MAAYLLVLSTIGVYFSRTQKTLDEVIRAGGGKGWVPVGLSLMAALNCGIDYILRILVGSNS